jgi:broad specificity phosphatase PhoE
MRIELVRHSKTLVEPQKPIVRWGLSNDGIERAKALSGTDVIKGIDVLYASLQTKALETAVYLAKPNVIPIKINNDFTEITSFTNRFITKEQGYEQGIYDFYHGTIDRIADGENSEEALRRFNTALERVIAEESKNGVNTLGIVSHGNILSFFTAQYADVTPFSLHDKIQMPDVAVLDWDTKKFVSLWGEHI